MDCSKKSSNTEDVVAVLTSPFERFDCPRYSGRTISHYQNRVVISAGDVLTRLINVNLSCHNVKTLEFKIRLYEISHGNIKTMSGSCKEDLRKIISYSSYLSTFNTVVLADFYEQLKSTGMIPGYVINRGSDFAWVTEKDWEYLSRGQG